MKLSKLFSLVLSLWLAAWGVSRGAEYTVDPDHSSITFKVKHLTISTVTGKFSNFRGKFTFDEKKVPASKVQVTIVPDSVDTGVKERDNHLRSDAFFDVKTYPEASFKSTQVSDLKDGKFTITGNLSLHGVTKPVVLNAEYGGAIQDDAGAHHVAFTAETVINRQDYGVDFNQTLDKGGVLAGDEVKLFFEIEGILTKDMVKK
jgi:polyisoprenoid-binding protein YceI